MMMDLAHSSAAVMRGLRRHGVRAKVRLRSYTFGPSSRPNGIEIITERRIDGREIHTCISMELVRRASVDIFEYEGEAHARLYLESGEHKESNA